MRCGIVLLVACAALPVRAAPPRTVALMGVTGGAGFDERAVGTVEELLLVALQHTGRLRVTGQSDIARLVGFERRRQLAGCEDSSCLAELAGALGVDFVASADLGRLGELRTVTFKLIDVRTAEAVVRVARRVNDDAALPDALEDLAAEAVSELDRARPARGVGSAAAVPFFECGGNYSGIALFAACDAGRVVGVHLGAGLWARATGDAVGAQGSLFYSRTGGSFRGVVQGALLGYAAVDGDFTGAIQGAPATRVGGDFRGFLQIGGRNATGGTLRGWQLGAWNDAAELRGVQTGAFNRAGEVRGVQMGVVNVARELHGVQLGLANVATQAPVPFLPVANASF